MIGAELAGGGLGGGGGSVEFDVNMELTLTVVGGDNVVELVIVTTVGVVIVMTVGTVLLWRVTTTVASRVGFRVVVAQAGHSSTVVVAVVGIGAEGSTAAGVFGEGAAVVEVDEAGGTPGRSLVLVGVAVIVVRFATVTGSMEVGAGASVLLGVSGVGEVEGSAEVGVGTSGEAGGSGDVEDSGAAGGSCRRRKRDAELGVLSNPSAVRERNQL